MSIQLKCSHHNTSSLSDVHHQLSACMPLVTGMSLPTKATPLIFGQLWIGFTGFSLTLLSFVRWLSSKWQVEKAGLQTQVIWLQSLYSGCHAKLMVSSGLLCGLFMKCSPPSTKWSCKNASPPIWFTSVLCMGPSSGYPFQYSCRDSPVDRGDWQTTAHGVAKSQTRLSARGCTYFWLPG